MPAVTLLEMNLPCHTYIRYMYALTYFCAYNMQRLNIARTCTRHAPCTHCHHTAFSVPPDCSGDIHVLIASTVVEVGVDVPEASVMLVEAAARFGLAQLHQLRGRVGRGSRASRCFLMAPPSEAEGAAQATERLRVLEDSQDGLYIAERDLAIR